MWRGLSENHKNLFVHLSSKTYTHISILHKMCFRYIIVKLFDDGYKWRVACLVANFLNKKSKEIFEINSNVVSHKKSLKFTFPFNSKFRFYLYDLIEPTAKCLTILTLGHRTRTVTWCFKDKYCKWCFTYRKFPWINTSMIKISYYSNIISFIN